MPLWLAVVILALAIGGMALGGKLLREKRTARTVLMVLLALLVDCTILPVFTSSPLMPLWTLMTVHCLGLLLGRSSGALYGLIAGILVDISVSTPLGLMTALYTGMGYLGGWFARRRIRRPLTPLLSSLIGFAGYELFLTVYVLFASGQMTSGALTDAGIRVLIHMVLSLVLCWLYEKLLRPSRSRYARI